MENVGGFDVPFMAEFDSTNIENYTVGHADPNHQSVFPDGNAAFNYLPGDVAVESTYDQLQEPPMFEMQNNYTHYGDINQAGNIDIPGHNGGTDYGDINQAGNNGIPGHNGGADGESLLPSLDLATLMNTADHPQASPNPVPFECCFCQVLREIIHTNGTHGTKLEIHGRLGIICHAILRNRLGDEQYERIDLRTKSAPDVREYISRYCEERKQSGFIMLQDPLLVFYDVLCPSLDVENDINVEDYLDLSSIDLDIDDDLFMNDDDNGGGRRASGGSLTAQRKRAAELTMGDLSRYFEYPIQEAARRINLCPTVLKKFCRKKGLVRWPHRKVKMLMRQQQALQADLRSNDANTRARAERQFRVVQEEMNRIYGRDSAP